MQNKTQNQIQDDLFPVLCVTIAAIIVVYIVVIVTACRRKPDYIDNTAVVMEESQLVTQLELTGGKVPFAVNIDRHLFAGWENEMYPSAGWTTYINSHNHTVTIYNAVEMDYDGNEGATGYSQDTLISLLRDKLYISATQPTYSYWRLWDNNLPVLQVMVGGSNRVAYFFPQKKDDTMVCVVLYTSNGDVRELEKLVKASLRVEESAL